ncbi:MAG TPA: tetratricopeptide repeat protein [Longimicrobiales bacterium]|nr:tetratricopeptide repeat protein [Longimicrobiales bacterium]
MHGHHTQLRQLGRHAFERKDYSTALEHFRAILADHPEYADIRHFAGLCLVFLGRPEEAVVELDAALAVNPGYVEANINRALVLQELGRYEEARLAFEEASEHERRNHGRFPAAATARLANAHAGVGDLYMETGAPGDAAAQYYMALELRPQFHDIRNKYATALLGMGRLDEAAQQLRRVLKATPTSSRRVSIWDSRCTGREVWKKRRRSGRRAVHNSPPTRRFARTSPCWSGCDREWTMRDGRRGATVARPFATGLVALIAAVLVAGCNEPEPATARGDRLFADSNYAGALAEYRLAFELRKGTDELARVAHTYALTGQFERARESYDLLLERAPEYTDQAVFDYLTLARRAQARSDRFGMAGAVEAALQLRAGLPVGDMAAPLARYYARAGDSDRARDFYERALGFATGDSVPDLLFDFARFQESQGNCAEAVELFGAFRARRPRGEESDQARWNIGNCSFTLAQQARENGEPEKALEHLQVTLDLGVPQNLMDQAWFERGEALLELGRRDEALQAYIKVLENARTTGGSLTERARQRIDQLRFGTDPSPTDMESRRPNGEIRDDDNETWSPRRG